MFDVADGCDPPPTDGDVALLDSTCVHLGVAAAVQHQAGGLVTDGHRGGGASFISLGHGTPSC
jgi:hypothetical protein